MKNKFLCKIVFLAIFSLLLWCSSYYFAARSRQHELHVSVTTELPSECPWKLLYARPSSGGRFGNRLIEYASAWAVAQRHNLTAIIADNIASSLRPSFQGLSLATIDEFIGNIRLKNELCALKVELQLLKSPIGREEDDVKKLLEEQSSTKTPISIRPHIILEETIVPFRKLFRQEMHHAQNLITYVQYVLQNVSKTLQKNQEEITFVGVHVRLTDYPRYITGGFGKNARPVDANYYLHATTHMLDQLERRNASNIVFLIVSDDEKWCTANLIPPMEQLVSSRNWRRGKLSVRWSGSSSYRQDFALLSSCNHSIIAYGTYGGGSALLAGGMTLVYDINRGEGGLIGGAMRFAALIPEWTLLY